MNRDKQTGINTKQAKLYGLAVLLMILAVFIAYAQVTTELKVEGEGDATEQEGVYITDVEYLTNNGADTENSKVNYFLGTMLDSKVVLGSSSSSTITYKVTIKNNTDREQVFIGIVKDNTNEIIYSNTNIEQVVTTAGGITGIEKCVTIIAPGEKLTFPVTFKYVSGASTSNPELQSKINFRFRELPIVELTNDGEIYTLEDVSPGYEKEIEFTVSNYNKDYTNGVPLTYSFETVFTEGCPLVAKIYDSDGNEVTESIEIAGDNSTQEDHTYTLKLTWDSSVTGDEYKGQEYTCNVKLKATPDNTEEDLGYKDYVLEKGFDINITTRGVIADGSWDGEVNTPILTADMHPVAWDESGNEFIPKTNEEWYDYTDQASGVDGTSHWANAKTSDGSYWVWIPRYEYKITSQPADSSGAGTIDVNFIPISTNAATSGYTTTTNVNQTVNGVEVLSKGITVSSDGYIIHPAFTSDVAVGGWDSELAGIWVAKYEMSMEKNGVAVNTIDGEETNVATSSTIKAVSKPGVPSWISINVSNAYENSLAYDTSKESHLIKSSEWGAVAYLTHSQYGRNRTEVTFNASCFWTGGGEGALATTNIGQSTTGNAYGIYDLSGGAHEHIAAFNAAYSSSGTYFIGTYYLSASGNNMGATGLANGGSTKYLTAYSNSTVQKYIGELKGNAYTSHSAFASGGHTVSITGDAISEVWTQIDDAWFVDTSEFINMTYPFFWAGGRGLMPIDKDSSYQGVFCRMVFDGGGGNWETFRVCLANDVIQDNCTHTYSDWVTVKEACVEEGLQKRICSQCGHTETQTIAATGVHEFGSGETTESTCVEQGIDIAICDVCGYEETTYLGYARTHDFVDGTCTLCGLNYPVMTADMTAVAWDESGNEFTPTTDEEWFDYWGHQDGDAGESNWANAKTSDGSYWVWIPRFEYKIDSTGVVYDEETDTTNAGTIDVRFIPTTTNSSTTGYTTTTAVNQTVNGVEVLSSGITVSSDGYIIHPAFTSDPDIGGWDSELAGIWVAKYEMSMETSGTATTTSSATIGNVAISDTVKMVSKPGVTSWRYINISNCYENSLAYDSTKNSHLMKNSEWGAVAYLTHSSYGRNGTEVTMNDNESYYTAGGSGATATTNVAQSSTGNETGIYDLSGGVSEFVAAFNDSYSGTYFTGTGHLSASGTNMGTIGLANGGSTKYLTAYSNSTDQSYIGESSGNAYTSHSAFAAGGYTVSITGDAISEVWVSSSSSSTAWFSDASDFVNSSYPFFDRGSHWNVGGSVFCAYPYTSRATSSGDSFRVCLAPQEISFYIDEVSYTTYQGTTWEAFIEEHPETGLLIDYYGVVCSETLQSWAPELNDFINQAQSLLINMENDTAANAGDVILDGAVYSVTFYEEPIV